VAAEAAGSRIWVYRAATAGMVALIATGLALTILGPREGARGGRAALPVQQRGDRRDRFEAQFEAMGTQGRFDVLCPSARAAQRMFQSALARVQRVEQLMSTYRPDSEVSVLNRDGAAGPVALSPETMVVMRAAVAMSELTGGAFDVTYAPLRTLWRGAVRENREPGQAALDGALAAVGWRKLQLTDSSARFTVAGMEVDLGGIAKGYAIDLAAEALQEQGAEGGIVDIGGDLRLFGRGSAQGKWRVLVRRPPGVEEEYILVVGACSVTTSGDYERWFRIGERRFSHIVDPRTGRPVARVPSVTVVAPDATMADGLATAISVLGAEKGVELADSLDGVECMVMEWTGESGLRVHMSAGFAGLLEE
jgi:thiamine biosynthesis lipoprotein